MYDDFPFDFALEEQQENLFPVAFYFDVSFQGDIGSIPFKEVSGLTLEIETESILEGGVNDYEYKLPKQVKHGNLILKRALMPVDEKIVKWVKRWLDGDFSRPIERKEIIIKLLNQNGNPLRTWTCMNAYPVKWEIDAFDSEQNKIVIESIELTYFKLTRDL